MLTRFIKVERNAAALILLAALAGLLVANLGGFDIATNFADHFGLDSDARTILISPFFLLVGIELRREFAGSPSLARALAVPALAAIFGVVVPAALFIAITWGSALPLAASLTPVATDITFSLAVFSLIGRSMPKGSRTFLLSFAVIDDLIAIALISALLASQANPLSLLSVAAVIAGLAISPKLGAKIESPLHTLVAFAILPAFAFLTLAIKLDATAAAMVFTTALGLGILARAVGKIIGISFGAWLGAKLAKPANPLTTSDYLRLSTLGGIGFTVAFMIANIAFAADPQQLQIATLATLFAAVLATGLAALALRKR